MALGRAAPSRDGAVSPGWCRMQGAAPPLGLPGSRPLETGESLAGTGGELRERVGGRGVSQSRVSRDGWGTGHTEPPRRGGEMAEGLRGIFPCADAAASCPPTHRTSHSHPRLTPGQRLPGVLPVLKTQLTTPTTGRRSDQHRHKVGELVLGNRFQPRAIRQTPVMRASSPGFEKSGSSVCCGTVTRWVALSAPVFPMSRGAV